MASAPIEHDLVAVASTSESAARGLTSEAADRLLSEFGPNDPSARRRRSQLGELLALLANPLVIILLVASAISAFLGELANALIVVTMVALSIDAQLRADLSLAARGGSAARDGGADRDGAARRRLARAHVRRGRARATSCGSPPATSCPPTRGSLEARDLHVQQAALTGESHAGREGGAARVRPERSTERRDMVLLGTSVVSGTATALVVATGRKTAFGDIAARLAARPPETEFERGMRQFGLLIMRTVIFLVLFILVVAHRAPPRRARVAALRRRARRRPHARVLADDHVGHARATAPCAMASTRSSSSTCRRSRTSAASTSSAATRPGRSPRARCRSSARVDARRRARGASARARRTSTASFETGIRSPLDVAILDRVRVTGGERLRRRSTRSRSTSSDGGCRSSSRKPRRAASSSRREPPRGSSRSRPAANEAAARQPLDDAARAPRAARRSSRSASEGLRVLAVAWRAVDRRAAYGVGDERDLVLVGFLAFADPLLPDAARGARRARARRRARSRSSPATTSSSRATSARRSGSTQPRSCSATRSSR